MKICIVTLYKTYNCGSYWQAFALGEFLKKHNCEVTYCKVQYSLTSKFIDLLKTIKKLLFNGKSEFLRYKKSIKDFKTLQKKFEIVSVKYAKKNSDLIILGSDTIWNLESRNLLSLRKLFFGNVFSNIPVISYAASIANTKIDDFLKFKDTKVYLNNLKSISVRDEYSKSIISKLINKEIKVSCDPTLLIEKQEYKKLLKDRYVKESYIFIYLFDDLNQNQIKNLKEFANKKRLKIISGTKKFLWCDTCLKNSPFDFLNGIYYADYVITDTFHGTAFSVNLEKNFLVIQRNKNKVNEFLKQNHLLSKLISCDNFSFEENNYIKNQSIINNSIAYLLKNINIKKED